MFCLVKKCKLLKDKSKIWNKTQFENVFRQLHLVNKKLPVIQEALISNQLDKSLQSKQDLLLLKRSRLLSFGHEYWKQKGKATYLSQGDANKSYFHAHASIRIRNQIKEFVTTVNTSFNSPTQIKIAFFV